MNKREEPDGRSRVVQRQDKIEYCEAPRDSPADKVVSSSKILLDDFFFSFFVFHFMQLSLSLSMSIIVKVLHMKQKKIKKTEHEVSSVSWGPCAWLLTNFRRKKDSEHLKPAKSCM